MHLPGHLHLLLLRNKEPASQVLLNTSNHTIHMSFEQAVAAFVKPHAVAYKLSLLLVATLGQEGVIASNSVQDVVLENCNARGVRFDCPSMARLSLRLSNIVSFTVQECSSLRCLDLQGVSTSLCLHVVALKGEA